MLLTLFRNTIRMSRKGLDPDLGPTISRRHKERIQMAQWPLIICNSKFCDNGQSWRYVLSITFGLIMV